MFTISNILEDVQRGILAHNMVESEFSYRVVYYVNENDKGTKHYIDTSYGNLRKTLENIVRNNLALTNGIVVTQTTVLKDGKCVCLQSRAYAFSLDGYFQQICGGKEKEYINSNYRRRGAQWC